MNDKKSPLIERILDDISEIEDQVEQWTEDRYRLRRVLEESLINQIRDALEGREEFDA